MRRRSEICLLVAGMALLFSMGWMVESAAGQAPASQTPATQAPATQTVPLAPPAESSSPLAVDSDPVPSPDADTAHAAPTAVPSESGVITKENGRFVLRADAYEVRLNASVIDSSGRTVDSLPQDAFRVFEDGVPQEIRSFRHEDLPVSLGILIDSSGSMYDKRRSMLRRWTW